MLEEEMKKRKLNKEENLLRIEFPEMAENQMDQAQLTRKVSDLKELVDEIYGIVETKDQEIFELKMNMKNMERNVGMMMKAFQTELDAVKEVVKGKNMEKEKVIMPKKTVTHPTATVKEPAMETAWKSVQTKKKTNKAASTAKDVLPQIPPKHQNTVAYTQPTYLQKLKQDIKNSVNPVEFLLKKEKIHSNGSIISWTLRIALNEKGQNFPRQSMLAVIEDITGKAPQSISVVSTSTAQILFKEDDLPCCKRKNNKLF
jgi:hypothetical protein